MPLALGLDLGFARFLHFYRAGQGGINYGLRRSPAGVQGRSIHFEAHSQRGLRTALVPIAAIPVQHGDNGFR